MRYLRTKNGVELMVMIALLASVALLRADPGDLDLTFGGGDGYVTTDIARGFDFGVSMVIDSGGRILVAGQSVNSINSPDELWGSIVRYTPEGTLDTTFGNEGIVLIASHLSAGCLCSMVLDSNERILVVGTKDNEGLLARFNSDGTPDPGFGNQGIVTGDKWFEFAALGIKDDGKIIVAGSHRSGFAVARYNVDGTLDLTFGNQGISPAVPFTSSASFSLLINQDNSLVIVGDGFNGGDSRDIILAKFTSDGEWDLNFGDDGVVVTDLNQIDDAFRIISDNEGRILIAGSSGFSENVENISQVLVARYLPDGSLDATFGNNGIVLTGSSAPNSYTGYSVVIDSSNRIIVTGQHYISATQTLDVFLARYNSNGSLDTTFSNDGYLIDNFLSYAHAIDVKLDDTGKIVIAGMRDGDFLVARYESEFAPTATLTITDTPTETSTLTATFTLTPTSTLTATETAEPTLTGTLTPLSTPELHNLIENGGFETGEGTIDDWQLKRATKDKIKCDKPGKPVAYEGECAFRFKGSVGENSQLFQKLDLAGQTFSVDDVFTLQAYIHARGQVDFQAQAKFTYADDTKAKIALDVNAATGDYTVFADDYALTDASLVKVKVALKNKSTSGKLDVDAVSLNYMAAGSSLLPLP